MEFQNLVPVKSSDLKSKNKVSINGNKDQNSEISPIKIQIDHQALKPISTDSNEYNFLMMSEEEKK